MRRESDKEEEEVETERDGEEEHRMIRKILRQTNRKVLKTLLYVVVVGLFML